MSVRDVAPAMAVPSRLGRCLALGAPAVPLLLSGCASKVSHSQTDSVVVDPTIGLTVLFSRALAPGADPGGGEMMRRPRWPERAVVAAGMALVLATGCASSSSFGTPPRVAGLTKLAVGQSTATDILLALGEPRGRGAARFPVDPQLRTVWFYEYLQAEGGRTDLSALIVFVREDRYEGYLWFSASQLIGKTE